MVLSVCLIVTLLIILCLFKIKVMHPVGVFALLWMFFIVGSLLLIGGEYSFDFSGINWLLIAIIVFVFGFSFATSMHKGEYKHHHSIIKPNIPWNVLILFILLGFGSVMLTIFKFGIDVVSIDSFMSLQDASHEAGVERYSGSDLSLGLIGQILACFVYAAPACAGYSLIEADTKGKHIICICSFAPAFLCMMLTTGKLSVVASVMLFFAGYYTSYLYEKKKVISLNLTTIIKYIILGVLLIASFVFSFVLRIGSGKDIYSELLINKMSIYVFGHIQGFDTWFANRTIYNDGLGFGAHTFLAISSRFGAYEKKQGVYDIIQGACTNVYTQFRCLIEDYGAVGAMFLMFLFGIIVGLFYTSVLKGSGKQVGSQVGMIIVMFCCCYFIISPWIYLTYYIVFIIVAWFIWYSFNAKRIRFIK